MNYDSCLLADAYIETYRPDDDELATAEWYRSVGFKDWPDNHDELWEGALYIPMCDELGWKCFLIYQCGGLYVCRMCDPDESEGTVSESVEVLGKRNKKQGHTRRDVRELCKGLKIPMKEGS